MLRPEEGMLFLFSECNCALSHDLLVLLLMSQLGLCRDEKGPPKRAFDSLRESSQLVFSGCPLDVRLPQPLSRLLKRR